MIGGRRQRVPPGLEWTRTYHDPQDAEERGVYPFFHPVEPLSATRGIVRGRERIIAGSNNYLGLTHHPRVVEASREATQRYGTGLTGSRLLNGTMELQERLEARLAAFLRKDAALVFPAGYLASLGVLPALTRAEDHVFLDKLVHASLVDAAALAAGTTHRFPHRDAAALARRLDAAREREGEGAAIVVTDGVFSMDGDVADLRALSALCRARGATLIVDDAHGLGVLGARGAGTAEAQGVEDEVDVTIATFSKALGSLGGVVAGPAPVMHYLKHHARSFLFTAALPPAAAAGAMAALDVVEEEPERRARLARNSDWMRARLRELGFTVLGDATAVIPVLVGGHWWPTMEAWKLLFDEGVLVNAVLPPAVRRGAARLRVTVTSEHSDEELERIAAAFARLAETLDGAVAVPAAVVPAARET